MYCKERLRLSKYLVKIGSLINQKSGNFQPTIVYSHLQWSLTFLIHFTYMF